MRSLRFCFLLASQYLYLPRNDGSKRYLVTNAHVVMDAAKGCTTFPELGKCKMWAKVILACQHSTWILKSTRFTTNIWKQKSVKRLQRSWKVFHRSSRRCRYDKSKLRSDGHWLRSPQKTVTFLAAKYPDGMHTTCKSTRRSTEETLVDHCLMQGNLIGVCAASFDESEGITLAIPWHDIDKMLCHYWDKESLTLQCPPWYCNWKINWQLCYRQTEESKCQSWSQRYLRRRFASMLKSNHVIGWRSHEFDIDRNGLVNLKHQLDKVKFSSLNVLLLLDPDSTFIRIFDGKRRRTINFNLEIQHGVLRNCMPVLEPIECFIFGGVVFCQFYNNHIEDLEDEALDPGIVQFLSESKGSEPTVVITSFRLQTLSCSKATV